VSETARPVLFSYLTYPGAAGVAEALDIAFPWDETPEGAGFWLTIYDKLMSLAGREMDSKEFEFLTRHFGLTKDLAAELVGTDCSCEVCEAGGNCCSSPIGSTIGELLAAAHDQALPAASIGPKNRRLILKAATELAPRLAA
jgi:hypothetical protein